MLLAETGTRGPLVALAEEMLESEDWSERKAAVRLLHHWDRLTSQMQSRAAADPHVAVRRAAATLKIRAC